jgi:hypothetical protein
METPIYAKQLEKKLIDEFKAQFFKKMGYYPLVVTKVSTDNDGYLPIITLENLEEAFESFLPVKYNKKVPLGSNRRFREVVELRNIFCSIARMMKYTTTYIGEYLGNRDHTTVLHNTNTFNDLIETSSQFKEKYLQIIKLIKQKYNDTSTMDDLDQEQFKSESSILFRLLPAED